MKRFNRRRVATPLMGRWRCSACHKILSAPRRVSVSGETTDIGNARAPHAGCSSNPPGTLIPLASIFNLDHPEWKNPIWREAATGLLGELPTDREAQMLGFASLAELCFCVGMDPAVSEPWGRAANAMLGLLRRSGSDGTREKAGLFKVLLVKASPILLGLWAAGDISQTGLEEMAPYADLGASIKALEELWNR